MIRAICFVAFLYIGIGTGRIFTEHGPPAGGFLDGILHAFFVVAWPWTVDWRKQLTAPLGHLRIGKKAAK